MRLSDLQFHVGDKVRIPQSIKVGIGEIRDIDLFALPDGISVRYVVFKLNGEYGGIFHASQLEMLETGDVKRPVEQE